MFKQTYETKKKSPWVNTCKFIIVHHTATWEWTAQAVIRQFTSWNSQTSCHFVIDTNGDMYKIWNPEDIQWHAWQSQWWQFKDMNKYSIWIEVIWPLKDGWFTFEQQVAVKTLIRHLMKSYWIVKWNVLRHADLTHDKSKDNILWDWVSKSRKVDIANTFFQPKYNTWADYQASL